MHQEHLDKFAEYFNEDYPNYHMTLQQIGNQAMEVLYAAQLVYKPIPEAKEAEYLRALEIVKRAQEEQC